MAKRSSPAEPSASAPGTSRPERMLAAAALIDQAIACLRSHPDEAEVRLKEALRVLGARKRIAPGAE